MSGVFEADGAGGVIRPAYYFDSYSANVKLSNLIPAIGVPQNTHGTRIFSGTIQVPLGRSVEIRSNLMVLHNSGTNAMVAAWFVDNELYARGVTPLNHIGSGYHAPQPVLDCFIPPDDQPHTIHLHVGPSAGTMTLNGSNPDTGPLVFGGCIYSTFFLEEK